MSSIKEQGDLFWTLTFPPEINSNDFGWFLELSSRFEFEFCRRENYFFEGFEFFGVFM